MSKETIRPDLLGNFADISIGAFNGGKPYVRKALGDKSGGYTEIEAMDLARLMVRFTAIAHKICLPVPELYGHFITDDNHTQRRTALNQVQEFSGNDVQYITKNNQDPIPALKGYLNCFRIVADADFQIALDVHLANFLHKPTTIYVGSNLTSLLIRTLDKTKGKNLFVVSKTIYPKINHLIKRLSIIKPIIIDSKEENKTLSFYEDTLNEMYQRSLGRQSIIIAIGGGMIGDYAGFLAASYRRGIGFIYIPTTLMSQCDPILNKVGLNAIGVKNLIGCFYAPSHVFCDIDFLNTLSENAIDNGLSEIIKHALLKPNSLLKTLQYNRKKNIPKNKYDWGKIIYESIKIKSSLISEDPYDSLNIQKKLNYGHTFGHAYEEYTKYACPHGYAVTLGMKFAGYISGLLKIGKKSDLAIQDNLIELLDFELSLPEDFDTDKFISLLRRYKHSQSTISLILLKKLGKISFQNNVEENLIRKVIIKKMVKKSK